MELITASIGAIIGATSVWLVNIYRAKVDHKTAINRQMLSKRLSCAEKLNAISYKATRKILFPKNINSDKQKYDISYDEVHSEAVELLEEMWEVIDIYGVYFEEKEYKELVNIPDYFIKKLRYERKQAENGDGGIEDWNWRIAFGEGQASVRKDVKTVCLASINYSRIWPKSGKDKSKLTLKKQHNKRFKTDAPRQDLPFQ